MNLVSIIIPVYNVHMYMDKCVESIVNQSYKDLEIILVDDGSTDGSGLKCDKWEKKDDRITVIHKKNGGLSDARNAGLELVNGDFIGFVDSDDWIEQDLIQLLVEKLHTYDADVSCCRFSYVYDNEKIERIGHDHRTYIYEGLDGLKEYLYGIILDPFACCKLYKSNLLNGKTPIRFEIGIQGEDNPFNIEVFKHVGRTVVAGESKYYYLQKRDGAITNSPVSQKKIDSVLRWDSIRNECHEMYPNLEEYALRRQALFYIGLYNRIINCTQFSELASDIRLFISKYRKEICRSDICEIELKSAVTLIALAPKIYRIVMIMYKRIKGEARL